MTSTKPILKNYLICFFLFGVYPRNPFCWSKYGYTKILSFIPRMVHLFSVVSFAFLFFRYVFMKPGMGFDLFFIATSFVPNIAYIFGTEYCTNKIESIIVKLNKVECHLKTIMNISIDLNVLKSSIIIECIFGVVIPCFVYFLKIFIFSTSFSMYSNVSEFILLTCKSFAILLILILLDYKNILIRSLNQQLESFNLERFQVDLNIWKLTQFLRSSGVFYCNLHEITQMINVQFGFFLIAVFLDMFNVITNCTSVFFLAPIESTPFYNVIRKYFFKKFS